MQISSLEEGKIVERSCEIVRPGRIRVISGKKCAIGVEVDGASAKGEGRFGSSADVRGGMSGSVFENGYHQGRSIPGGGIVSDCNKIPRSIITKVQRVRMGCACCPVTVTEENPDTVSGRSTEIDPDAVSCIGGAAHRFIDPIE